MMTWKPYQDPKGVTVKDPIAAAVLGGNNPNATSGTWSYDHASDTWSQKQPAKSQAVASSVVSNNNGGISPQRSVGAGGISLGSTGNYGGQLINQIQAQLKNKPTAPSASGIQIYKPQTMAYEEALGKVGGSYQMRGEDELAEVARLRADLEINPQRQEAERQRERAELDYHNKMRRVEQLYSGKDEVAQQIQNKMSKQQAQELAARGANSRSGLAAYQSAQVSEAVAQQLTALEINRQANIYDLETEFGLKQEQIDGALMQLEERRGKLSADHFEKLSAREQEIFLQQENARSEIALNIMNQFMSGEQLKLQSSIAAVEAVDRRYAKELEGWLGGLKATLDAYQTSVDAAYKQDSINLNYLQTMLPYTQMTAQDKARMDLAWAELMGETPRR